jgi:hypothetical protein
MFSFSFLPFLFPYPFPFSGCQQPCLRKEIVDRIQNTRDVALQRSYIVEVDLFWSFKRAGLEA